MNAAAFVTGFEGLDDGRGLALTDWDHDGDLDLWMSARTSPAVRYFENQSEAPPGVAVRLRALAGARDAIGARLVLETRDGRQWHRSVRAGEGFLSQSSKWVFFGLPEGAEPARLRVQWPNGRTPTTYTGMVAGGRYLLIEGASQPQPLDANRAPSLPDHALEPATPSVQARLVSPSRLLTPRLEVESFEGGLATPLQDGSGPTLVVLWASWCPNCQVELRDLVDQASALQAAGVSVIALSTDRLPGESGNSETAARRFWARLGAPFPSYWATQTWLDSMQTLHQTVALTHIALPLPTSFLVDESGRLAVIYRGPVTSETVLIDGQRLVRRDGSLNQSATPFLRGRDWRRPTVSPLTFARNLYEGGLAEEAIEYAQQWRAEEPAAPSATEALYFQANIHYQLGRFEASRDGYAEVLNEAPQRFTAARNAARLSARLGEWPTAIRFYERARELAPQDVAMVLEQSRAAVEMEDFEGARRAAREALALNPTNREAQEWLREIDRLERNR